MFEWLKPKTAGWRAPEANGPGVTIKVLPRPTGRSLALPAGLAMSCTLNRRDQRSKAFSMWLYISLSSAALTTAS